MNYKEVIFCTGGKQIVAKINEEYYTEKIAANVGDTVFFTKVLAIFAENELEFNNSGNKLVEAVITKQGKSKKIVVFKYKPKKNYKVKYGHRQPYTKIKVVGIVDAEKFNSELISDVVNSDFFIKMNDKENKDSKVAKLVKPVEQIASPARSAEIHEMDVKDEPNLSVDVAALSSKVSKIKAKKTSPKPKVTTNDEVAETSTLDNHIRVESHGPNLKAIYDDKNLKVKFVETDVEVNEEIKSKKTK